MTARSLSVEIGLAGGVSGGVEQGFGGANSEVIMPTLHKLTALEVRRARGRRKLNDGGGLTLNVRESGAKSWTFVYRFEGRRPEVGLGSWPAVTLSDAPAKAAQARKWLSETPKRDPRAEWQRKAEAARPVPTRPRFGDFAIQFIKERARGWKHPDNERQ